MDDKTKRRLAEGFSPEQLGAALRGGEGSEALMDAIGVVETAYQSAIHQKRAEEVAQTELVSKQLFGDVNKLWRQGKPTGTASLLANLNLLEAMGADWTMIAQTGDWHEFYRLIHSDQRMIRIVNSKTENNTYGGGDAAHQTLQELVLLWTAARLGRNPSMFRMSSDFQRQLLATEHEKAVVSDLHLPLPALVLELEPGIELENRHTGLHPLQALGITETRRDDKRILTWSAYCGAKRTSKSAFDDNYQCGTIMLDGGEGRIWTYTAAREAHELEEGPVSAKTFEHLRESRGGAVDGEEHNVPDMMRALDRLVINAVLYMSQENPSIQRASNRKPVTKAELVEAPKRTKVRVGRRNKRSKTRGHAYLLGAGEGTVRVAYKTLVRGHWRHQPYGKGRLLRRTIWIKPHVRHKDAPGEAAAHEYSAQEGKT
jgi:hypothetical protein